MFGIGFVCLLPSGYLLTLQIGRLLAIFVVNLCIFSMCPSVVMCFTMGYLFHVWGGVGVGFFFL